MPPAFGHGPSLLLDFENAIRRSRIESSRYEFKQGILRLDGTRQLDTSIFERLIETVCAIANVGPDSDGNLFVGVADKKSDSERITALDGVSPIRVGDHYVVGVEREAKILQLSLEQYIQKIVGRFQKSDLSEPLKTQTLGRFDPITIQGLTVLRVLVPKQTSVSFVAEKAFSRQNSSTIEVSGQQLLAVAKRFPK